MLKLWCIYIYGIQADILIQRDLQEYFEVIYKYIGAGSLGHRL